MKKPWRPHVCPCGCVDQVTGKRRMVVNSRRTFVTCGCWMRLAVRTGRWKEVIARREASMTVEQKRARIAHMHGPTRAERWDMLMDRWLTMWEDGHPREALTEAYRRGYLSGNSRTWRGRKKQEAS